MIAGERVLQQYKGNSVVLTTHRVRYAEGARVVSITLDEVSSVSLTSSSKPSYVLLGLLLVLAALPLGRGLHESSVTTVVFFGGALFFLIYLLSRKQVIDIGSSGDHIVLSASGAGKDAAIQFLDAVEAAKLQWLAKKREETPIPAIATEGASPARAV